MATELLPTASTAANSSDVVVAAGIPVGFVMKDQVTAEAVINVKLKDEDGNYHRIFDLTSASPANVLWAPGTYRLSRVAGATCGAFSG